MNDHSAMLATNPSMASMASIAIPTPRPVPVQASAVSWAAVFAGAAGAAALSLILVLLGTGLGLSAISPWADRGASATTLGVSTIVWVTLTQIVAAVVGGYLAGRLRTRWVDTHTDEVYFRDTAHGFLAWGVATLVTAAFLGSAISSMLGAGAKAGAAIAGAGATAATAVAGAGAAGAGMAAMSGQSSSTPATGATGGDRSANPMGYFVDSLFRRDPSATAAASTAATSSPSTGMPSSGDRMATNAEVTRILTAGLSSGTLPPEDARYVGQLVAQQTGMSPADAEKRVNDTFARVQAKAKEAEAAARDAADKARKASAYTALWLFVSLLAGAFCASLAATFGGRLRDKI